MLPRTSEAALTEAARATPRAQAGSAAQTGAASGGCGCPSTPSTWAGPRRRWRRAAPPDCPRSSLLRAPRRRLRRQGLRRRLRSRASLSHLPVNCQKQISLFSWKDARTGMSLACAQAQGCLCVFKAGLGLGWPVTRVRRARRWRRRRWRTSTCAAASAWTCSAASCAWASRRGAGAGRPGPPPCRASRPRRARTARPYILARMVASAGCTEGAATRCRCCLTLAQPRRLAMRGLAPAVAGVAAPARGRAARPAGDGAARAR